jgi:hypothetical protein
MQIMIKKRIRSNITPQDSSLNSMEAADGSRKEWECSQMSGEMCLISTGLEVFMVWQNAPQKKVMRIMPSFHPLISGL